MLPRCSIGASRASAHRFSLRTRKSKSSYDNNFIIGAGTKSGSDSDKTDGIVDGHAYSILTVVNDAAGTDIDLIKMRNPWGQVRICPPHL